MTRLATFSAGSPFPAARRRGIGGTAIARMIRSLTLLLACAGAQGFGMGRHGVRRQRVPSRRPSVMSAKEASSVGVGSADLDWPNLGFQYRETNGHMKMTWKDGSWSAAELVEQSTVTMHVGATALHYGQSVFEGLKAFAQEDGSVRLFRPQENAARLARSCERIRMPVPSEKEFLDACKAVVRANMEFVPPYGTGGALYLRPLLFGSGARIGLQPADEYTFLVLCTPVGDYYQGGMGAPVTAVVMDDYDRAAPLGVGHVKVAGNYAADLLPNMKAKGDGYPVALYLDAQTHTLVEEFSTSNFVGITKAGEFVTPDSAAVLPSITNKSLQVLAEDMGMPVQKRAVPVEELADMTEAAACGTAVVITPVSKVVHGEKVYEISSDETPGPVMTKLYDQVRGIQCGDVEDPYGWTVEV